MNTRLNTQLDIWRNGKIQVCRRRFAFTVGITFVGVKECKPINPVLRLMDYPKISFVTERPAEIDRRWLRTLIMERIKQKGE
jgi:hypothetical protein